MTREAMVVAVPVFIFLAMFGYLVYLDLKLARLERSGRQPDL